ncbi:MAG: dienelactone hydrolase family protein [Alphaproteobacteria bacterium]|nr:dienelactone hydrolase family protein [Alphaproteobacteria bacterium]
MRAGLFAIALTFATSCAAAAAGVGFRDPWPEVPETAGEAVRVASLSPFVPRDIGEGAPAATAQVTWFAPAGAGHARKAPAVVLLHGAGGVVASREITYARQLAAMGIGAAVVDVFAARRDLATSFADRIIEITETMALADAYATLGWLSRRPEIDAARVALWGFSYGAMSSIYATNAAIADRLAEAFTLGATRFAAHIAFYGPCITTFDNDRTTGAPVLMAWGAADELINAERCRALADDLRNGGSTVQTIVYPGAYHQWDGGWIGPRRIGRLLDGCEFRVSNDLVVRAGGLGFPMTNPFTRKLILAFCVGSDGYLMGRDDAVRERSNRDVAAFLARALRLAPPG